VVNVVVIVTVTATQDDVVIQRGETSRGESWYFVVVLVVVTVVVFVVVAVLVVVWVVVVVQDVVDVIPTPLIPRVTVAVERS